MRARIHAALGDPSRLAIVVTLALGDASPGEVGAVLGMPTNLVAHHLKVLTGAGLVVRTRSEWDRRRTYLRLVPDALAATTTPPMTAPPRVVLVCTHNSARSRPGPGRHRRGVRGRLHRARDTGRPPGPGEHPKRWTDEVVRVADVVVTMGCGDARPVFPGKRYRDWTFDDPAGLSVEAVRPIRDAVERRVPRLLDKLHVPVTG